MNRMITMNKLLAIVILFWVAAAMILVGAYINFYKKQLIYNKCPINICSLIEEYKPSTVSIRAGEKFYECKESAYERK